jgi:hypothetical protein
MPGSAVSRFAATVKPNDDIPTAHTARPARPSIAESTQMMMETSGMAAMT